MLTSRFENAFTPEQPLKPYSTVLAVTLRAGDRKAIGPALKSRLDPLAGIAGTLSDLLRRHRTCW
jgi:hypothetical protein